MKRRRLLVEWLERRELLAAIRDESWDEAALFSGHSNVCNCPICTGQGLAYIAPPIGPSAAAAAGGSPLTSLPQLRSDPTATAKLFLDFDGHFESSWHTWTNITTPAFDIDGDATTFSSGELAAIQEIWARVSEDYAPFNIDVTTIDPGTQANNVAAIIAIGGSSSDWYGQTAGGISFVGGFYNAASNVGYAFASTLGGNTKNTAEAAAHEAGHLFGLQHQALWNGSTLVDQYNPGNDGWAPIMGVGYYQPRTTWHNGTTPFGATVLQDDLAIISNSNNNFGWRPDDFGNALTSAATLPVFGSTVNVSGLIGQNGDQDVWSFSALSGPVSFQLAGAAHGTNLDAVLELRNAAGQTVVLANPTDSFGATIATSLTAGNYFLLARSSGGYGSLGQYTITGSVVQGPYPEIAVRLESANLVDGQPVDFGTTAHGLPVSRTFTVHNEGTSPLTLTPLNPSGLPAGFELESNLGATTLGLGQSTSFSLQLTASVAGTFGGPWQLFSNDADESPFDFVLAGVVTAPDIVVRLNGSDLADGQIADLGSALLNNPTQQTFTVVNDGSASLLLTPFDPATLPTGFSLVANLGLTELAPGQSTTFVIGLDATSAGSFSGPLYLFSNDPDESPFDLVLIGTVTAPEITVGLDSADIQDGQLADFGTTALATPISRTFTVTNDGTATLVLAPLSLSDLPLGFTLVSNLGLTTLAPGQATSFTVRLDAVAAGQYGGAVRFSNNDNDENPFDLVLAGRVVGQEISVLLDGVSLLDGAVVDLGTAHLHSPISRTFTVRNDGLAPLELTSLIDSGLPAQLTVTENLGLTSLLPGQATSFAVRLAAHTTGEFSGQLRLLSSDVDESPFDLVVVGRVVAPEITVRQGSGELGDGGFVSFGTAIQGQPLDRTFTITNDGGAPLSLSPLNPATLPAGFTLAANLTATTLAAGQSTTFTIRLAATTAGSFGGTLALATSDPDENPFDLLLAGNVIAPEIAIDVEGAGVLDGQTVDFGVTTPAQPIYRTFTVRNEGTAPLALTPISPASVPAGFTLVPHLGATTLAPGQSTSFSLRLEASAIGTFSGPLVLLNSDADEGAFHLLLAGRVAAPEINVQLGGISLADGQSLSFGAAVQGAPVTRVFVVVNEGTDTLQLTPLDPGSMPAGFTLVSNIGAATLEPGQSTAFMVRLEALAAGAFGGTFALTSNDADENPFELTLSASVTAPEIAVELAGLNLSSGAAVDFGTVPLAIAVQRTFTIRNTGDASLVLAPLNPGALPAGFSLVANLSLTTLGPGQSTSFTLRLDATAAGTYGGPMPISNTDADENPFTLSLAGQVIAPEITVRLGTAGVIDGQIVDFGSTREDFPVTRTFLITNDGQAPLALTPLNPINLPAGFSVVANVSPALLAPGQSTTFALRLDATAGGAFGGLLQLANNDPDENPFDLLLSGTVTAPEIRVDWSGIELADGQAFDFGGTLAGVPLDRTFTVHNAGTAPLDLTPLTAASLPAEFSLLANVGQTTLAPGQSTDFVVRLNATSSGAFGGPLVLANTDADENPFELLLAGSVSVPEIAVVLDGAAIASGQTVDFGVTLAGAPQARTFTILNIGASPLELTPLSPTDLPAGFTLEFNLDVTSLAPGQATSFTLSLDASSVGTFGGALVLANNDLDESAFQLRLAGSVVAPEIALEYLGADLPSGELLDFGVATQGQPVLRTLAVFNRGTAPLTLVPLEPADLPAGFSLATNLAQTTLPPGQAISLTVRLDAAAAGSFGGVLALYSDDADESPFELALTGSVIAPEITVLVDDEELATGQAVDFGAILVGGSSSRTFTVRNDGDAPLTLAALDPAALPAGFTLVSNLGALTLAPGAATTFTLRLSSVSAGTFGGLLRLANDDADENPFDFVLSGNLTAPEIAVMQGGVELVWGQAFDWGTAVRGTPLVRSFTIANAGGAPLELAPLNPASLPAGFSLVTSFGGTTLAPGESETLTIQLDAAAVGSSSGILSLGSNDADENPFRLQLSGAVIHPADTNVVLNLPAGGGNYTLDMSGDNLRLRSDSQVLFARTLTAVATFELNGTNNRETLTVSYAGGNPAPAGGVRLNAGGAASPGDLLVLQGAGSQALDWSAGDLAAGGGTVAVDGGTIVYAGVAALDVTGMSATQLQFAASAQSLAIGDGVAHRDGSPALVVSGTAAGQPLPAIALRQNSSIALHAGSGDDIVALTGAASLHGNANLSVDTGADPGDRIEIEGPAAFSGGVSLTSHSIAFTQPASVVVATSVLLNATGGSIDDASPAEPSVRAASLVASAATGITLSTAVDTLTARTTAAGHVVLHEANAVALTDVYAADGNISVVAGGSMRAESVVSGAPAARNISLAAIAGSLEVGSVGSQPGASVHIEFSAGESVVPLPAGQSLVRGAALTVQAGAGIGLVNRPLLTAVGSLDANGGSGGVFVTNAGDLLVGASGSSGVTINTSGSLDVVGDILSDGSHGAVWLVAGHDLMLRLGATVAALNDVRLEFGQANTAFALQTATFTGHVFSATSIVVSGGDGPDRFVAAFTDTFAGRVTLQGRGGDDAFILKPQVQANVAIYGGHSTDALVGDVLDLDLTPSAADPRATAIVSTAGGLAQTTGYGDVTFSGLEGVLLRDEGLLTNVGLGDLYIRGTQESDIIEVGPVTTAANVHVRVNERLLTLPVTTRTLVVGRGGNDALAQLGVGLPVELRGGVGDDLLTGDTASDVLLGGAGRDTLVGHEGDDYLAGEAGDDALLGGEGNDRLYGGSGHDALSGDDGDDLLAGNDGNDQLHGGIGHDVLIGGIGADLLSGHEGHDLLITGRLTTAGGSPASTSYQDSHDRAMAELLADWSADARVDRSLNLMSDDSTDLIFGSEGSDTAAFDSNDSGDWDYLLPSG